MVDAVPGRAHRGRVILLRTLGTTDVVAPDRPDAAAILAQPKRFGLLAYLATAAPGGFVRRDTLLALFWPETDQAKGRQVLRQTIYLMRQSLGTDAIVSRGGEDVGVAPDVLESDVTRFERALADGRPADALASYRGDYLTGFHVPDAAPELAEWIDRERSRLRAQAVRGAWQLAEADEARGNVAGAAYWARRAAELDPHDENGVRDLMRLLARVGDRAGAVRAYQEHVRRLAEDLGVEPGAGLIALASSLRAAAADTDHSEIRLPSNTPSPPPPAPDRDVGVPLPGSPARARTNVTWAGASVLIAIVAVTGVLMFRGGGDVVPATIAIGPIADRTGADTTSSNVPADLLSTSLGRLSGLTVIPLTRLYDLEAQLRSAGRRSVTVLDAARHAGAGELLRGELRDDGGRVRLELEMLDARTGEVVRSYTAAGASVFAAVDEATRLIARAHRTRVPEQGIAAVTTPSLIAYRIYEQGLREFYQHGDARSAHRLFTAALAEDSTFALAAYYAFRSAGESNPEGSALAARAVRLADRTADRERLLILSQHNLGMGEPVALAQAETLVVRFPAEPDGHFALGATRSHAGDFAGGVAELLRVIAMDSIGLHGGVALCRACDAYANVVASYLAADSIAAAERAARSFLRAQPRSVGAWLLLAEVMNHHGRYAEAYDAFARADQLAPGTENEREIARAALEIRAGDYAAAERRLRAVTTGPDWLVGQAEWLLALTLRNLGRMGEALDVGRRGRFRGLGPDTLFALGNPIQLAQTLLESGSARESAALYDTIAARPPFDAAQRGKVARHRAWYLTHEAAALAAGGDTARLAALADSIEAIGLASLYGRDRKLHHHVRGLLLRARGRRDEAERHFRLAVYSWSTGYTRTNLALAELLLEADRPHEAVPILQAALRGPIDASNLYVLRSELHELLARAFAAANMPDSAAAHDRHVAEAWRGADPPYRVRAAAAAERLRTRAPPTR